MRSELPYQVNSSSSYSDYNCSYATPAMTKFKSDALIFPHPDLRFVLYYLCGIILTVIIYLGIALNILSIAVFARDRPTKTTSVFLLQALAIADSVYLMMIFIRYPLPILIIYSRPLGNCLDSSYAILMAENLSYLQIPLRITGYAAIWMVLVVTMDRYIALYYTLKATKLCQLKFVIIEIIVLLFYCCSYSVSKFIVLDMFKRYDLGWLFWTWDAFNTLAPVVTVFVLNFRIWRSLIVAKRWRTSSTGSCQNKRVKFSDDHRLAGKVVKLRTQIEQVRRDTRRERLILNGKRTSTSSDMSNQEVHKMSKDSQRHLYNSQLRERAKAIESNHRDVTARLIAVATSYLICEIPMTVLAIYAILLSWFSISMDKRPLHILYLIAHAMQCVNSSVNFGLYFFSGRRFRRNLYALFRRQRQRPVNKFSSFTCEYHADGSRVNSTNDLFRHQTNR